jgi:Alpha/beta hydrolase domain
MKQTIAARAVLCALVLAAVPAVARVMEINVSAVEPLADGHSFGATGAYERVKGTFKGEIDPADARNKVIVNIDKAPRNAVGKVEYEADFYILRPVDAARGNPKIIYDVTNRGRKNLNHRVMDARPASLSASNDPSTLQDIGNGLFLRMGFTVVWSGWDPDAPRSSNGMTIKPIVATNGGAPIVRVIRDELVAGTRDRTGGAAEPKETLRLTHEAATLDQTQARLSVRRTEQDPRREIPASGWTYVNAREIRLPAGTVPEPGSLYEFHYPAKNPRVYGVGLAATRDLLSFLRYEKTDTRGNANPARSARTVLGFGSSQSGRFLRDYVKEGFNQDEAARKVFDGILAHTAGAGGVFLNYEFGQPIRTATQHEDRTFPENAFPFSTARMTDPVTGKTGSLFRGDGFDPLWMETNTSTEYWQKGASLLSTDPLGERDVELPANARGYLLAGTQHAGTAGMRSTSGPCTNARNPHNPNPALRALLVALDEWTEGKLPPPSRIPRVRDGTLVAADKLGFPPIPGMKVTLRTNQIGVLKDWIKPELDVSKPYRTLVPQIDLDGNEVAGLLLPDIAVPLGTHTGWNLYKAPYPEGELCDRDGSYVPFPSTKAERETRRDPRASLEERYGGHAAYLQRLEDAALKLVGQRLLLREDDELILAKARNEEVAKRFPRTGEPVIGLSEER